MSKKILIIATSHDKLGEVDGPPTGSWAEEIAAPYFLWKNKGYSVTIASVKGGKIPIDEASLSGDFFTEDAQKFYADPEAKAALEDAVALDAIQDEYDAIYLPGGHGVMWDLPGNVKLADLLTSAYKSGKVVSAVCHGPAGFVAAKGPDGQPLVQGKNVTGFSNSEEEAVGKTQLVPYLLEDKLKQLGGTYTKADDWSEFAVTDGRLVTGQNPQSSKKVAEHVIAVLEG